jgi:hypothetical protein
MTRLPRATGQRRANPPDRSGVLDKRVIDRGVDHAMFGLFSYDISYPVAAARGATLTTMQSTTNAIRAAFVAVNPGKDAP